MLRNIPKYIQQRFPTAANDPVWHWAKLFDGISPPGFVLHDLDAEGAYRGHHLFIEAKPVGAQIAKAQIDRLETLARNPLHSVLLLGLESSIDKEFKQAWREVCWVWIGNPKWRKLSSVQFGSVAEFKAMIVAWFARIDALQDHIERKQAAKKLPGPEQLTLDLRYAA
jgi:hypothetical protein